MVTAVGAPSSSVASPSSTVASHLADTPSADPQVYAAAEQELRDYLDVWRREGGAAAAARYLVPSEQPGTGVSPPALASGKVVSCELFRWASADSFTLLCNLELRFVDSQAPAGGGGGRFVTFTRPGPGAPYLMNLATGP